MTPVADDLIHSAQRSLARAALCTPHERYAAAHLAKPYELLPRLSLLPPRSSQVRANRPVRRQVRSAWNWCYVRCVHHCRSGRISLPPAPDPCRC